jgi:post-segregation antitoxin (ccd killing protein)
MSEISTGRPIYADGRRALQTAEAPAAFAPTVGAKRARSRRRALRPLCTLAMLVLALVLLSAQGLAAAAPEKTAGCPGAAKTSVTPAASSTNAGNSAPGAGDAVTSPAIVVVAGDGGDGKVSFGFGRDRSCQTRRITFQIAGASTATGSVSAAVVGDLLNSNRGKVIPYAETGVTVPARDANGNYYVTFGVHPHHEGSGDYSGLLQITAPGAKPLSIPVDVTLRSSPVWAIVWLLIGLLLGYVFKWWGASGSVLEKQLPRLELVDRRLRDISTDLLPQQLLDRRADADSAITNWDADAAKAALDEIQTRLEAIVGVALAAERLLERLDTLRAGPLSTSAADIDSLAGEIRTAASTSWDDAAKAMATVSGFADRVTKLEVVASGASTRDMVAAITRGETLAPAAEPETLEADGLVSAHGTPTTKSARGSTLPGWQRQFLRRTGAILFFVTLVALASYGYATQYDNKPTFGAAGLSDWITLGGWGFATALAGKTIADYFGPGTSSPVKPA